MCLIAISPKGTKKYSELFIKGIENGGKTNDDGYGFACKYANCQIVYHKKGFKTVPELIAAIKAMELSEEDELIVHCRTGNRGDISKFNCHPYVVSDKQSEIIELEGINTELGVMMHNG